MFFSSFKPSVIFARSVFISPVCSNSDLYPSSMSLTFVYPCFFKNASTSSAVSLGILVPHTTFLAFLSFLCFSSYLLSLSLLGFIPNSSVNISSYLYDDYILLFSAFRVKLFFCERRVKAALNFQFRRYSFPWTSAIILFSRYILKSRFPTCSEHLCPNSLDKAYPAFSTIPLSKLFSCQFHVIIVRRFFNLCLDSSFCAPYFVCFSVIPLNATAGKLLSTIIGKLPTVWRGVSRKFYKKIAEKFSRQPHIKRKSDITQTSFFDYYICLQFFFTDKIKASCLSYYLSSLKLL